jgi:two-component system, OmpR family, heavy metal sensor histidine kinase CusS
MRKLSIGFRLTLWYLAIFAAAQLAFGLGMWIILRRNLYRVADEELQAQVEDLTRFLQAQKKNATVAKLQEEVAEAYVIEHSGDFLQIIDSEGNWIFRAASLQRSAVSPENPSAIQKPSYQDRPLAGRPFRFVTARLAVNSRVYAMQTAVPMDQVLRTLSLFRRYLLMFAPLLLLAAASGGYWLSRKALSPVDVLTQNARNISGSNLSARLEVPRTGDELQRLSDTLNEMLGRIESAFLRVTEFTADASHELRAPISLIRTEAEIALRRSRGATEYRDALRHILLEAERTTMLVEELLSLARADCGREILNLVPLDMNALVAATGQEWQQLIEARNLRFSTTAASREIPVLADRVAMQRLIAILLDNAVKYTPAAGVVELHVEQKDQSVIIRVCDSGIGIAKKDQSKIFERFYRVDKARSREFGGAGIGLAIAQWIVQQHHGSITVQSSLGCGSTFLVKMPLYDNETGPSARTDREPSQTAYS